MYPITSVTSDPRQRQTIQLADGTSVLIRMEFSPMQLGWFFTEITYGDFTVCGMRVVNSPNILHQFKNQIPFGLACFSDEDREPMLQRDFSSGASILYILSADEIKVYEDYLSGV